MVFEEINQTGIIGSLLTNVTINITGDVYLTFLLLFVGLLMFLLAFRIPLEVAIIVLSPILIMFSAFIGGFQLTLVLTLLFIGFILAKFFFI